MKKIVVSILILWQLCARSQNKQVLYDFAELPQTLLLNPGAETNYKFHVGVPLLSGFSSEIGNSGFTISDLFAQDNRPIKEKITEVLTSLRAKDFGKLNSQIEILSGGFRYDDTTFFSFGFYQEMDAIGYFPKDIITLVNEGNASYLNKSFDISQVLYKLDFLGVIHAGITKKINDKFTLGGRFKIYSSALNIQSTNNYGTFRTDVGPNNIYRHSLNNVYANLQSAGLVKDDEYIDDASVYLKNTFLGGNLGMGIDVGFTYHVTPQLEFTGSILDFGFINYKKNIKNTVAEGDFVFEGLDFEFEGTVIDYWADLNARFEKELPTSENQESYISWRPTKINAALKYSFGERRSKICYDNNFKEFYTNAVGIQVFNIFRPLNPQMALTAFYQKSLSNKIHTKFTYTVDDLSYANIGAGLSVQLGKLNVYGMVDNILEYKNIAKANSLSLQIGINVIFN